MTKRNPYALILFCRTPAISREKIDSDYAALPWADLQTLFAAFVGDLLMSVSHLESTDVLVYRDPAEWSDEDFHPFRHMVKLFELTGDRFTDQVARAIDQAFRAGYGRVVVTLENDPRLTAGFLGSLFDQLGFEDDCAVLAPTREGRPALVGFKSNHSRVFDSMEGDPLARPDLLLRRLCALEIELFLTRAGSSLENGAGLEGLGRALGFLAESSPAFPARSSKAFATLGKKYARKRSTR
jgi:hypothetical protein